MKDIEKCGGQEQCAGLFARDIHSGNSGEHKPMDARDRFAAAALTGMLAHECGPYSIAKGEEEIDHGMCEHYARTAYALADAMMKVRDAR